MPWDYAFVGLLAAYVAAAISIMVAVVREARKPAGVTQSASKPVYVWKRRWNGTYRLVRNS